MPGKTQCRFFLLCVPQRQELIAGHKPLPYQHQPNFAQSWQVPAHATMVTRTVILHRVQILAGNEYLSVPPVMWIQL